MEGRLRESDGDMSLLRAGSRLNGQNGSNRNFNSQHANGLSRTSLCPADTVTVQQLFSRCASRLHHFPTNLPTLSQSSVEIQTRPSRPPSNQHPHRPCTLAGHFRRPGSRRAAANRVELSSARLRTLNNGSAEFRNRSGYEGVASIELGRRRVGLMVMADQDGMVRPDAGSRSSRRWCGVLRM